MTAILRSLGENLRVVGPLTTANFLQDPSFESADPNDYWFTNGSVQLIQSNVRVQYGNYSAKLHFTSSSGFNKHGIGQALVDNVQQESFYVISIWVNISSQLPAALMVDVNYLDSDGGNLDTETAQLVHGAPTSGWIRPSYRVTIPPSTSKMSVLFYVSADTSATPIPDFYMDGMMIAQSDSLDPYVDGDFSSHVWSGDPYSTTLLSTSPDELRFFNVRPGFGAVAEMFYPNVVPLVS